MNTIQILSILQIVSSLLMLLAATYKDIKTKKIPNIIPLIGIAVGFVILAIQSIVISNALPLLQSLIWMLICFIFGMTRVLGMGDIKLIMSLVILSGPHTSFVSVAVAAILSIILYLLKEPKDTVQNIKAGVGRLFNVKYIGTGRKIPFSPFLLAGYICTKTIFMLHTKSIIWI